MSPRNLLSKLVRMLQGSMMSVSPAKAQIAASHCGPRMRSPKNGHAISSVQIGIV